MAKKKPEAAAPAISTIPLPDQETPLVIDLPDGQKLVVGNIAQGTVIEVATWRGTGRPDSRTSRLMLGVSSNATAENSSPSQTPPAESENGKVNPFSKFLSSLIAKTPQRKRERAVAEIDKMLEENEVSVDQLREKKVASRVAEALDDSDDIQSWLDELMNGSSSDFARDAATSASAPKVKRISTSKGRKGTPKKSAVSRSSSTRSRKSSQSRSKSSKKR